MLRLNIIGCGSVGKSLGRLWSTSGTFEIGDILNRSLHSSQNAVDWIGAGRAIEQLSSISPADIFLISTNDDSLCEMAMRLSESNVLKPGNIVLHCSGAVNSNLLESVTVAGAYTASIHPVKSFATPCSTLSDFAGTFCGSEGDSQALEILEPAFAAIGATTFRIDPAQKKLYHAASVISCNYLTSLIELSAQAYEKAGIPRATAMQIMQPIVMGTADNIFKLGTTKALTGPIARGDHQVVEDQHSALKEWNPDYADIYSSLGKIAYQLAAKQNSASKQP